jgi:hypothetical protein
MQVTQKARRQVDIAISSEELAALFVENVRTIVNSRLQVNLRIKIDGFEAGEQDEQDLDDVCELRLRAFPS